MMSRSKKGNLLKGCGLVALLSGLCLSAAASAEDEVLTIQGTSIRGNQELPTILYLVPWQAPEVLELEEPESSLAVTRTLEPLERSEFQRLLRYHEHFMYRHKLRAEPQSSAP